MNRSFTILGGAVLFCLVLSAGLCIAKDFREVEMKIKSVPTDWNITLRWSVPDMSKTHSILLVRKEKEYPQSTKDGSIVYTGYGQEAVDKNLVADTEYFYRFFLVNSEGDVTGWARHKEKT